ncbi:hypothetical protein ACWGDT_40595 [Streptomyces avermitilis]
MDLFFVSRTRVLDRPALFGDVGAEALRRLDYRALPDRLPVIVDTAMRPMEPACSWFRHRAYLGRDPEDTLRHYAYIVLRLMEFLAERGRDLSTAVESDLVAYRRSRTELQDVPVGGTGWDREASVINTLLDWMVRQRLRRASPLRAAGSSNPLSSGMSRDMDIRHLTLDSSAESPKPTASHPRSSICTPAQ